MESSRWQEIDRLYHAARRRRAEERAAFLAEACGSDEALQNEVLSLLAASTATDRVFGADPGNPVSEIMSDPERIPLTGRRLGVYRIEERIGTGGMGEVYRARDLRLGREVAVKVLPPTFTADPARLTRFEQEAHLLASLNHPNIATIHGVEEADGVKALVMELVEGETLSERIARSPKRLPGLRPRSEGGESAPGLPVVEVLSIARQLADALEAAHQKGIIHRDLKPANIKITPAGTVKVLDFGLARTVRVNDGTADASDALTAMSVTQEGFVVGTVPYMSPEQTRGEPLNEQTDIWAFGCVVYEMLMRRGPFHRRSVSDVFAAILSAEPDWTALPPMHPRVTLMLERCLEKDRSSRYHTIADARADLAAAVASPAGRVAPAPPKPIARPVIVLLAGALAILGIAIGAAAWMLRMPRDESVRRFSDVLPANSAFTSAGYPLVAVAPDDSSIVYVADNRLFVRSLDRSDATPIAGTEGAPTTPFVSPDGRVVGYWDTRSAELKRIAIEGGIPIRLAKVTNVFGATWQPDGTILYGAEDGVWRVSAIGGTPERILQVKSGERVHAPQLLPDGQTLLFTWRRGVGSALWEDAQVVVQSTRTGERKVLFTGAHARWLPTGHLVYAVGFVLFAVPFDLTTLEVAGAPTPVISGIRRFTPFPGSTAAANYDVSRRGTLVYVPGGPAPVVPRQLVAVDRGGRVEPVVAEKIDYWRPRVSPDGSRIAVEVRDERGEQLWIIDRRDGSATPLINEGPRNVFCTWTADGESVIFRSDRIDQYGIYRQRIDGSSPAQLVYPSTEDVMPGSVSRENVLVFALGEQTGRRAIWTMRLDDPTTATEFLSTPAMEHMPVFSPDGKWIAYASDESGRSEVYIRAFPNKELVRRISSGGGTAPTWAANGAELYFRSAAGALVAVPMQPVTGTPAGVMQDLFNIPGRFRISGNAAAYDVEPGGKRFIMVTEEPSAQPAVQRVNIVLNWTAELKRRVATP